jgi:hypothetical protein
VSRFPPLLHCLSSTQPGTFYYNVIRRLNPRHRTMTLEHIKFSRHYHKQASAQLLLDSR